MMMMASGFYTVIRGHSLKVIKRVRVGRDKLWDDAELKAL
jgi:hypothetical protein